MVIVSGYVIFINTVC